jgi:hypothetical protein
VLAYRNPLQEVVYENYMTVRALRPFLNKWIDARLDDIGNGRIADPDKTIAYYWLKNAGDGKYFAKKDVVFECFHIARLDKLSRSDDVQQKLQAPDCRWDLVVFDEAHKLSATFFGGEVKYTKRYRLAQLLSQLTLVSLLTSGSFGPLHSAPLRPDAAIKVGVRWTDGR